MRRNWAQLLPACGALCGIVGGLASTSTPKFVDIATQIGITGRNIYGGIRTKDFILETTGNGVAIFDYDGDGRDDVLVLNGTRLKPVAGEKGTPTLYHNEGGGRFSDVSARAGFTEEGWWQGVCVGDVDNDGFPDVFMTAYGQNRLYRNRGDGTFADVTQKSGFPVAGTRYGSGCTFLDYDRDGKLDLFVSNYVDLDLQHTPRPGSAETCRWKDIAVMCGPRGLPLAHNILYRNRGDGTFEDVSAAAGILKPGGRYSLGAVSADFDNDGWPDIYVACDMTPSLFFRNRHDGTFEERGTEAGVAYNFDGALQAGMGVSVADYDGDGLLDIAKTNFSGDFPSLFHNDDGKFFTDLSREAGLGTHQLLGWGIAFVDVDDDGWRDLMVANGHVYPEVDGRGLGDTYRQKTLFYRNTGAGKFVDETDEAGPALRVERAARGLATGDLDGDGRPEIVIVNMNATPSVLKNEGPHGHFLNVSLAGTRSNRSAIGARVTVTAGRGKQVDEVMSGSSFYSQNSLTLHFGLGASTHVDQVEVRWPSGTFQRVGPQTADRTVNITEPTTDQP